MQADLPHVLYLRDGKGGAKPKQAEVERAWKMQEEANRKARARRAERRRREGYTVAELFSGAAEEQNQ